MPGTSLTVAGIKYVITRVEDEFVHGKSGANGFMAAASDKTIMVGIYDTTALSAPIRGELGGYSQDPTGSHVRDALTKTVDDLKSRDY
ncbi:hypothetical protein GCM10010211_85510 [Streptomyces albospinus]|uniref:Profilin n=1 Tax=Streptomyces albospinus TaxID=285515 RepID=A0ABQ2VPF5_9ACTN|nr:profilin family protein [Streptomyces albospinus]GGV05552.1 hypothetical protein GCM10010211_85510 [Streptomyces albospinus]